MKTLFLYVLTLAALSLGGCLSIANIQDEPVPPADSESAQTDDMYRQCKDKKRNRKDRFCVIKTQE